MKRSLLLLLLVGCSWNRAMYGYDRTISVAASEPDVEVYWQPLRYTNYPALGNQKIQLLGKTPFKVNTFGEGEFKVWAVKGDRFLRSSLKWQEPDQVIDFSKTTKLSRDEKCCIENKVYIGMESIWASISWGDPKTINRTTNQFGTHEQWVYGSGDYLYFDEGRLTTIQN